MVLDIAVFLFLKINKAAIFYKNIGIWHVLRLSLNVGGFNACTAELFVCFIYLKLELLTQLPS